MISRRHAFAVPILGLIGGSTRSLCAAYISGSGLLSNSYTDGGRIFGRAGVSSAQETQTNIRRVSNRGDRGGVAAQSAAGAAEEHPPSAAHPCDR
jgi:hypothetical protein